MQSLTAASAPTTLPTLKLKEASRWCGEDENIILTTLPQQNFIKASEELQLAYLSEFEPINSHRGWVMFYSCGIHFINWFAIDI